MNQNLWTFNNARALCGLVEALAPKFGAHIALTGGCLYKDGFRKDCNIIVYRIRQTDKIDVDGLLKEMATIGITEKERFGTWLIKAEFLGKPIDFMFPEGSGDGKGSEYHKPAQDPVAKSYVDKMWGGKS